MGKAGYVQYSIGDHIIYIYSICFKKNELITGTSITIALSDYNGYHVENVLKTPGSS